MAFNSYCLIVLLIVSLVFSGCGSKCSKVLSFEVPINIYPVKDTYKEGDTIWIEALFESMMTDQLTGELINVGVPEIGVAMSVLQLLDSNWISGIENVSLVPDKGDVNIIGISYPTYKISFSENEFSSGQSFRFGIILINSNVDLVLIFGKRDPNNWSGEFKFPESNNCIYGINSSTFLTNIGSQDYDFYVLKFPYFKETGLKGNQAENHRKAGAYFLHVD